MEGIYLNIIKAIYEKPAIDRVLKCETSENSIRSGSHVIDSRISDIRQALYMLTFAAFNHTSGSSRQSS